MSDATAIPDEDLVETARAAPDGDTRAFEALVERHRGTVVANCRYLSRSADDAEDLAQEVFVKAYFGLRSFEGKSRFSTWVQRIKINHCLNFIEKRNGKRFVQFDDSDAVDAHDLTYAMTPERAMIEAGEQQRITEALDALPDSLRVPLLMSDMDHLSYQEIADTLGIGLSAVKMRIKRGREAFRERFGPESGAGKPPSRSRAASRNLGGPTP
jgi:RNA polymerase sigma-70 factor (ECF subfamily)